MLVTFHEQKRILQFNNQNLHYDQGTNILDLFIIHNQFIYSGI